MRAWVVALVAACGGGSATAPAPVPNGGGGEVASGKSCTAASDCVLVEDCCGCSAGGRQFALRVDAAAEYKRERSASCADTTCPQMISTDPSCQAEAGCDEGRCKVLPHLQEGQPE